MSFMFCGFSNLCGNKAEGRVGEHMKASKKKKHAKQQPRKTKSKESVQSVEEHSLLLGEESTNVEETIFEETIAGKESKAGSKTTTASGTSIHDFLHTIF
uniref:Uncharacterized protein n=1 Tax=uncultured organism MedDCM-OCT-S09-C171 TaxID=743644 RepID=D6PJD0_9ZZZZ|nr:hypothetical protein [uncultured organism MedDCM-OCT-S09-C171]